MKSPEDKISILRFDKNDRSFYELKAKLVGIITTSGTNDRAYWYESKNGDMCICFDDGYFPEMPTAETMHFWKFPTTVRESLDDKKLGTCLHAIVPNSTAQDIC